MTDHNREEREDKLGIAAQRFYEASGLNLPHTSKPEIVAGLRAALAVFEQAHAPTDDEREALIALKLASFSKLMSDGFMSSIMRTNEEAADIVLAAGFRRTVQGAS